MHCTDICDIHTEWVRRNFLVIPTGGSSHCLLMFLRFFAYWDKHLVVCVTILINFKSFFLISALNLNINMTKLLGYLTISLLLDEMLSWLLEPTSVVLCNNLPYGSQRISAWSPSWYSFQVAEQWIGKWCGTFAYV